MEQYKKYSTKIQNTVNTSTHNTKHPFITKPTHTETQILQKHTCTPQRITETIHTHTDTLQNMLRKPQYNSKLNSHPN